MELPMDASSPVGDGAQDQPHDPAVVCAARSRLRKAGEQEISERLYSIILAVHAAQRSLDTNPGRLAAILDLIHTQSVASLEDLRRLGALR